MLLLTCLNGCVKIVSCKSFTWLGKNYSHST